MTEEELFADISRHAIPSIHDVPKASASRAAKLPTRQTVIDLTETIAIAGDGRQKRRRVVTQDSSETVEQIGLVVLKVNPKKLASLLARLRSREKSSGHPILGLEALIGELDEDDAEDARKVFDLVKSGLEREKDIKSFVEFLTRLFAPVKQRIAGKRARLSDDMARVEQEMRLFQEADGTPEVIKIEDQLMPAQGEKSVYLPCARCSVEHRVLNCGSSIL